jgi:hypothetical protein
MLADKETKINFEILKISNRLLDLVDLSLELPLYIKYKQLNNQTNKKQFDLLVEQLKKKTTKLFSTIIEKQTKICFQLFHLLQLLEMRKKISEQFFRALLCHSFTLSLIISLSLKFPAIIYF